MKDPLQKKSTPYEELGIGENSDKKAIDDAFKQAIGKGKNIKEVTQARTRLSKPVDRSLVDLFLYNDATILQLEYDPNTSPIEFNIQRTELGRRWAITQQNSFPCWGATHSLAVLWYWLAISEEEDRINSKSMSDPEPLNLYWYHVIGLWGTIVNASNFWKSWRISRESIQGYFGEELVPTVCQALETQFVNHFISLGERYRALDDLKSVKRMQKYEALWSSELKTGRRLNKSGVSITKGGRVVDITYGRFFLDQVGFLAVIKQQLNQILLGNPQNEEIKNLLKCLSPYFYIFILVENKKYEDALSEIENLFPAEQKTEEIQGLLAEIYLEKGKQYFSITQFDNALSAWQKGYEIEIRQKETYDTAVSSIKTKALAIQHTQFDVAVELLEKGITIFNDSGLKSTLAEMFNAHGVQLANGVFSQLEKDKGSISDEKKAEHRVTLKKAIEFFEKAKMLGHSEADKNIENTRSILKILLPGGGLWNPVGDVIGLDIFGPKINSEVLSLIDLADKTFTRTRNPNESISYLEKALFIANESEKPHVKKILAEYLNARAVGVLNKVTKLLDSFSRAFELGLNQRIDDFMNGREPRLIFGDTAKKKSKVKHVIWWILGILAAIGIIYLMSKDKETGNVVGVIWTIFFLLFYIIPMIYNWIKDSFKPVFKPSYNPYGGYTPKCRLCKNDAAYTYTLERYGQVDLCYSHSDKLKAIMQPKPYIDPVMKMELTGAKDDLNRAAQYDPSMAVVKDNLNILNQYLAMV